MDAKNSNESIELDKSALEMKLIDEFLQEKGFHLKDLCNLPEDQVKRLMIEACRYASNRLAEIEAKAHFRQSIKPPKGI
jgi:hypothetical protein